MNSAKGRKLTEQEKAERNERRKEREAARQKQIAEREALEKHRVAVVEKLISDERIDPTVRGQLCLMLNEAFPAYYPRVI